jgi:hypothetical protein
VSEHPMTRARRLLPNSNTSSSTHWNYRADEMVLRDDLSDAKRCSSKINFTQRVL